MCPVVTGIFAQGSFLRSRLRHLRLDATLVCDVLTLSFFARGLLLQVFSSAVNNHWNAIEIAFIKRNVVRRKSSVKTYAFPLTTLREVVVETKYALSEKEFPAGIVNGLNVSIDVVRESCTIYSKNHFLGTAVDFCITVRPRSLPHHIWL